jgi:hypothetical protein
MKLRNKIFILLAFVQLSVFSQEALNFQQIDSLTYNAYLQKDWKTVTKIGKQALKNDIDYYYLRMRLGIAHFEQKKYGKAVKDFEKAIGYNTTDTLAIEYLYYSYKYLGDDIMAVRTLNESETLYAWKMMTEQKLLKNIYAFFSTRIIDSDNLEESGRQAFKEKTQEVKKPIYTSQFIPDSYFNLQLGTTVRLTPSWRFDISYQYFSVKSEQQIIDPVQMQINKSSASQNQWNFNNRFRLTNKLKASLFFSTVTSKANYTAVNTTSIPPQYYKINEEKQANYLLGIGLSRQQAYFDIDLKGSFLTSIDKPILQGDLGVKIYPFANKRLISESIISFLKKDSNGFAPIFSQKIEYSPFDKLSFSLLGNWGDLQMWNTNSGYNIYNGIYGMSSLYQVILNYKVTKQLYFKLYYEYIDRSSNIWSKSLLPIDEGNDLEIISTERFNTHSIIGGLIWEF